MKKILLTFSLLGVMAHADAFNCWYALKYQAQVANSSVTRMLKAKLDENYSEEYIWNLVNRLKLTPAEFLYARKELKELFAFYSKRTYSPGELSFYFLDTEKELLEAYLKTSKPGTAQIKEMLNLAQAEPGISNHLAELLLKRNERMSPTRAYKLAKKTAKPYDFAYTYVLKYNFSRERLQRPLLTQEQIFQFIELGGSEFKHNHIADFYTRQVSGVGYSTRYPYIDYRVLGTQEALFYLKQLKDLNAEDFLRKYAEQRHKLELLTQEDIELIITRLTGPKKARYSTKRYIETIKTHTPKELPILQGRYKTILRTMNVNLSGGEDPKSVIKNIFDEVKDLSKHISGYSYSDIILMQLAESLSHQGKLSFETKELFLDNLQSIQLKIDLNHLEAFDS